MIERAWLLFVENSQVSVQSRAWQSLVRSEGGMRLGESDDFFPRWALEVSVIPPVEPVSVAKVDEKVKETINGGGTSSMRIAAQEKLRTVTQL